MRPHRNSYDGQNHPHHRPRGRRRHPDALIDAEGENKGVIRTREAIAMAQEAGLDLVLIAANSNPPVAKFLDLGRFKYAAQKKAAEA
ncbi:MAG: hypothetical protein J0H25_14455, partial [Rhizobiales bacterium]|nr:hypothetical protein [Hyphomicrobiales bacterium]